MTQFNWNIDSEKYLFPDPEFTSEEGILAIGGDLTVPRLLYAYSQGIFPWYSEGQPIIWWCPDPRFVLFLDDLKVPKSMNTYFNNEKYSVTLDKCFAKVIRRCKTISRKGQSQGSWITSEMEDAYINLHRSGFAHSVEVWEGDDLCGGLYGVALGKCFFGESMFTTKKNASKFALISLVRILKEKHFWLIDCQQETDHLASLGAGSIDRSEFLKMMKRNESEQSLIGTWTDFI